MDNATNVIEYFQKEIKEIAEKEKDAILLKVDGIISEAVIEMKLNAKQDAEYALKHKMDDANAQHAKQLAQLNESKNRALSSQRNEIANKVFQEAKDKLVEYTDTKEYEEHLCNSLKKLNSKSEDATLFLKNKDMQNEIKIKSCINESCIIKASDNIKIGGFILENKKAGIIIDESYDSLLEEQKEWFYLNSGLYID